MFRDMDGLLSAFRTFRNCAVNQKSLKLFVDTLAATNRVNHKYDPSEVGAICSALFFCLQHISFCMLFFFPDTLYDSRRNCCLFAQALEPETNYVQS